MCGRFTEPSLCGAELEFAEIKVTPFPRRFNIKPTQEVYVLLGGELTCARWGLTLPATGTVIFKRRISPVCKGVFVSNGLVREKGERLDNDLCVVKTISYM
jgi:putative SOS response-associated peptidase YedK